MLRWGQVYIVDPFHWRVYKHIFQISWKTCWKGTTNNDQIWSQFRTCLMAWAVMACAKLWPHWVINIKFKATYFSHWQDFNYEPIKPLWNDPLPVVINSECHVLGSVALIIVSCQPSVCFHGLNTSLRGYQLRTQKTNRNSSFTPCHKFNIYLALPCCNCTINL